MAANADYDRIVNVQTMERLGRDVDRLTVERDDLANRLRIADVTRGALINRLNALANALREAISLLAQGPVLWVAENYGLVQPLFDRARMALDDLKTM